MNEYQPIHLSPNMVILPRDLAEMALKALYGPDERGPDFSHLSTYEPYDPVVKEGPRKEDS